MDNSSRNERNLNAGPIANQNRLQTNSLIQSNISSILMANTNESMTFNDDEELIFNLNSVLPIDEESMSSIEANPEQPLINLEEKVSLNSKLKNDTIIFNEIYTNITDTTGIT